MAQVSKKQSNAPKKIVGSEDAAKQRVRTERVYHTYNNLVHAVTNAYTEDTADIKFTRTELALANLKTFIDTHPSTAKLYKGDRTLAESAQSMSTIAERTKAHHALGRTFLATGGYGYY